MALSASRVQLTFTQVLIELSVVFAVMSSHTGIGGHVMAAGTKVSVHKCRLIYLKPY